MLVAIRVIAGMALSVLLFGIRNNDRVTHEARMENLVTIAVTVLIIIFIAGGKE